MFLDGIFQPCLERGRLGALQGLLETLDPTLETGPLPSFSLSVTPAQGTLPLSVPTPAVHDGA